MNTQNNSVTVEVQLQAQRVTGKAAMNEGVIAAAMSISKASEWLARRGVKVKSASIDQGTHIYVRGRMNVAMKNAEAVRHFYGPNGKQVEMVAVLFGANIHWTESVH